MFYKSILSEMFILLHNNTNCIYVTQPCFDLIYMYLPVLICIMYNIQYSPRGTSKVRGYAAASNFSTRRNHAAYRRVTRHRSALPRVLSRNKSAAYVRGGSSAKIYTQIYMYICVSQKPRFTLKQLHLSVFNCF